MKKHKGLSNGELGDELTFAYPEALESIRCCAANKIAVLGVELMHRVEAGYRTVALSTYELNIQHDGIESSGWMDYVGTNNKCALEFVTLHPAGDGHVYILTAASWREFARTA